jgi:SHS2 domain-containing protein
MAYRISSFDHTADKGIIVHADSLPELYSGAAVGLFAGMYALDGLVPTREREVTVRAADRESLLVAWLQELIFWFEVEDEVYTAADVHRVDEKSLTATLHGCRLGPEIVQIGAAVKAVTYHGLSLRETADGWEAVLLFDV